MPYRHMVNTLYPTGIAHVAAEMYTGDKYRVYLPSYLGYGDVEIDSLMPAYANLIAEVEIAYVHDSLKQVQQNIYAISDYISEKGWQNDVQLYESGLFYYQISPGSGEKPEKGNLVKINYKGKFLSDEVFEKSADDKPFAFRVGYGEVIKGMDEGIANMKKGEKGVLMMPSNLAYWHRNGNRNFPFDIFLPTEVINGFIPPFSPLIFEVELLDD